MTIGARAREAGLRRAQHPRLRGARHVLPPRRDGGGPPRGGAAFWVTASTAASGASVGSSGRSGRTPHRCYVTIAVLPAAQSSAFVKPCAVQATSMESATMT